MLVVFFHFFAFVSPQQPRVEYITSSSSSSFYQLATEAETKYRSYCMITLFLCGYISGFVGV